ncbi:hypothetical protein V1291_004970 [Nitrobacteraceae bacterium AZCC 1564]
MKLPQHVIDHVERRWAAKLQQEVDAWQNRKRPPQAQELETPRTDRSRVVPSSIKISGAAQRKLTRKAIAGHGKDRSILIV